MVKAFYPDSLAEALKIIGEHEVIPISGGTDLMVQKLRKFRISADFQFPLLFLSHLQEMSQIKESGSQIIIGAATKLNDMLKSDLIPEALKQAISQMAAYPTRNLATIGGNICNASPAGDTLPFLYAVNASLILRRNHGKRKLPIDKFITAPSKIDLKKDELLTDIIIPGKNFDFSYYKKVGTRKAMSLSKVSFLGLVDFRDYKVENTRIAFGAVAPTVVRSSELEKLLNGKNKEMMREEIPGIIEEYSQIITPIDDARSTKKYRKEVALRILHDFLYKFCKEE